MMRTIVRKWMEPIDMQDGDEHVKIYRCRGLKLIGIRFYPYVGYDKEEERTAKCIQKSLYDKDEWFYFYKGFHIEEQDGTVTQVRVRLMLISCFIIKMIVWILV